jgi:hypothetical protein
MVVISKAEKRTENFHARERRAERKMILTMSASRKKTKQND